MNQIKYLLFLTILSNCYLFNFKDNGIHRDELDKAAKDLKNQLVENYKSDGKKTLAIASFARNDLIKPFSKYSSSVPKLGIYLANSLQNEMFIPEFFDLIERQRIDGVLEEINYSKLGISDQSTLESVKLTGADLILLGTIQKRENTLRFDARIVSISTAKIVSVATTVIPSTSYLNKLYQDYPERIAEYSEKIQANLGWQTLNYSLAKGIEYRIEFSGQWSMTNNRIQIEHLGSELNPSEWGDFRIFPNYNHGQLLCRLKENPTILVFPGKIVLDKSSFLECRINDNDLQNNIGFMNVKIISEVD